MEEAAEVLIGSVLAMLLGLFGQGLRASVGLKKQADEAATQGKTLHQVFDRTTFWFSLFLGAMAGMAAYLGMKYGADGAADFGNGKVALGIVSAGYVGSDFIEGFAKKYLPK